MAVFKKKLTFWEKPLCPLYNGQENNVKGTYTNGIQKSGNVNVSFIIPGIIELY